MGVLRLVPAPGPKGAGNTRGGVGLHKPKS